MERDVRVSSSAQQMWGLSKRLIIFMCLCCLWQPSIAQDGAATSAPILNPFNLKADQLGSMNSYVSQVSGELNLPMNLVSISGPSLGINVSIAYNSTNIENLSKTWNREAPTGSLGLGWSLDAQMIVVDNKQTGTREDDDFYLVEGGRSIKLYCLGVNSGTRSYRTGSFSNWRINYTPSTEKWEVIKDDGTRFIYGDSQASANAVQWTPRWGNWIGQSMAPGHQIQGMVWNLREVRTIWGDRISYHYYTGNYTSGGNIISTEYSILAKINDNWGHEVEFVHGNKSSLEYQSPPGIVFARSERFFVNKILVKTNGTLDYELQFDYSTDELGTSLLTKRLLKGIKKVSPTGVVGSNLLFEYASASQNNRGALNKVTFPTGGFVSFQYNQSAGYIYPQILETTANAPSGYAAPDVHISDDYALVTWRAFNGGTHSVNPMHTIGRVVDWQGKWRTTDLGSLGYTKFVDEAKDYRVVLSKDFFAVLTYHYDTVSTLPTYLLKVWRKSQGLSGAWGASSWTLPMSTGTEQKRVKLLAGNDFVCVSDNRGKIFRYTWNGSKWVSSTITETPGQRWVTATNNYILSHNPNPITDEIRIYYLDETRIWQTRAHSVLGFNSEPADSESETTNWYPSNSSAFVLANESNEMIIQWDENYDNVVLVDKGWRYQDFSTVYFDGSTIGLVDIYDPEIQGLALTHNRALRRAGHSWVDSGEKLNGYGYMNGIGGPNNGGWDFLPASGMASFGPDMMLWNANTTYNATRTFKYMTFNPGISQWNSEYSFSNTGSPYVNVGPDYFTAGGNVYFKQAYSYTLGTHSLSGSGDIFPSSRRFIATDENLMLLRNGDTYVDTFLGIGKYRVRNSTARLYRYMVGSSIVAVCASGSEENFKNVTTLTLRRIYPSLAISDYPITRVDINDGAITRSTAYAYQNPVLSQDEQSVMYNKVTEVPGSAVLAPMPFGHTETYFYNGLNANEVSSPFPSVPESNGHLAHRLLIGQPYRVAVFGSSQSDTVASVINIANVRRDYYSQNYSIGQNQYYSYIYLHTPRQYKSIAKQDGKTELVQYDFDTAGTRQLTRVTKSTKSATGNWDQRYQETTYAWQQFPYSQLASYNMLVQPGYTRQGISGGAVTGAAATRWKLWPCSGSDCVASMVPAPFDQYSWRGTNSSSFTATDVSVPPSADWKPGQIVVARDANTGIEIEVTSKSNTPSSTVLDSRKRTIASVTNAALSDISYSSFEDGTSGLWNSTDGTITTGDAKTGNRYVALGTIGLSRAGLTPATTYRVTFWAKSSGGSVIIDGVGTVNVSGLSTWTLFQYKVTGLSSINIRRSGGTEVLLDEVRLHPANALMTSQTYHDVFGATSKTDANNRTTYFDYNELGQPKFVRDENKNIIRHTFTNLKNP